VSVSLDLPRVDRIAPRLPPDQQEKIQLARVLQVFSATILGKAAGKNGLSVVVIIGGGGGNNRTRKVAKESQPGQESYDADAAPPLSLVRAGHQFVGLSSSVS
jgi:hypothetical protein